MADLIDRNLPRVSRRAVLRGAGVLVPGVVLATAGGRAASAAGASRLDGAVRGAFSAPVHVWATSAGRAGRAAPGVVFTLVANSRPLAGRRVRFSISEFHRVDLSVWFEVASGRRSAPRLGHLDLDTDGAGRISLDRWLRSGAVPTSATGAHPVLRAQLVGAEDILAITTLDVRSGQ
ncbi:hypothetical protein [Micromonospora sp. NPDC049497]|uniref:hypothetical protein n=1 Tax=Micromonospora sp. NPDC049497 TaxID=3364273 RepID=UPI00379122BA